MQRALKFIKKNPIETGVVIFSFLFSWYLMFHTFSYEKGNFLIASKAWSDFGSHIPLIRSFSYGNNFPPVYPLFPGEPIRYHFLFYLLAGILEKAGVRIDYALNIPSVLGFTGLLVMIYFFALKLFKSRAVGFLSVLFFLYNGSLSFLYFFNLHPLTFSTPVDIFSASTFPSFGPYDQRIVSAFWNLNIYTNQRHLGLSFAIVLCILYIVTPKELFRKLTRILVISALLIALVFLNPAAFGITCIFLGFFLLFRVRKNLYLFFPLLISSLIYELWNHYTNAFFTPQIKIGFLINPPVTPPSFLFYWAMNMGLYFFLIPVALFFNLKKQWIFIFPMLVLFILPNVLQFSTDIVNNHKLFNFYLIIGGMFVAQLLVTFWSYKTRFSPILQALCILTVCFLTFSGIIDFMVVKNDTFLTLGDFPNRADVHFFMRHTKPTDIILNSTFFYNPASLAGRRVFYGYPYFAWSYGYPTLDREHLTESIFAAPDKETACKSLLANHISYVELSPNHEAIYSPRQDTWNTFQKAYNSSSGLVVYNVSNSCK